MSLFNNASNLFVNGNSVSLAYLNGNQLFSSSIAEVGGGSFVNPTLTIGSAVNVVTQSPFSGGGNSYQFASNVNSFIDTPASSDWAVVRQSGVTKIFKNGVQQGTNLTDTNNITNTIDELTIGNENTPTTAAAFVGYITNFRWIKGLAVYIGNFTKPTSALTATAGANPYGGSNTQAIGDGYTKLLLVP